MLNSSTKARTKKLTTMTEYEIKTRIKSGVDLYIEKSYEVKDLYMHMLSLVKDSSADGLEHKKQCEHLIFRVQELLGDLDILFRGKKSQKVAAKNKSDALKKKLDWLLKNGYSVDEWKGRVKEIELF